MNELIKQLAEQAEEYADSVVDEGGDFHPEYTQKLAELIVGKCLEQIKYMLVDEDEQLFAHDETTDCVNESLMDAHHNIALEFGFGKQFGVEE